jgi:hypothetical protein
VPVSLDAVFTSADLQSITCLALGDEQRPVFLVTGVDGSEIVIKNEGVIFADRDPKNLKVALKTMQQVSPEARGKLLSQIEVDVITDYVELEEEIARLTFRQVSACMAYLRTIVDSGGMWFKMAKARGILDMKKAAEQLAAGDKSGVRAIAESLCAPDGLEALGRIIAADFWSGNNDRFAPFGATAEGMSVLQNAGNVIIAIQGVNQLRKPIGLDAYEAMGAFRHVHMDPTDYENADEKWAGRLLADNQRTALRRFCDAAIEDMETVLGPRNRKFIGRRSRLPRNAAQRLMAGIINGAQPIKTKMRLMAAKPGAPAGLARRLQLAGW